MSLKGNTSVIVNDIPQVSADAQTHQNLGKFLFPSADILKCLQEMNNF